MAGSRIKGITVEIGGDGIIKLNNERMWILKELNDKGVICLQYKDSNILRELIMEGEIKVESSLLSKPEWEYFNYHNRTERLFLLIRIFLKAE